MKAFAYRIVFFLAVVVASVALLVMDSPPSLLSHGLGSVAARNLESNAADASPGGSEQNATLERLKRANLTAELKPGSLDSYKKDACIFVGADPLAGKVQKGCIKGTLGILMPSSAYVMIAAGNVRVAELANAEGGWRITAAPVSATGSPTHTATKLADLKLTVLKEQIAHSLVSLFRLLNDASESDRSNLKLSVTSSHVVVTWAEGATSNQFFFNRKGLLCDKQVRTTPEGVTVLNYGQYKNVNGVMLPHRIEMGGSSGKVISTEVVETWTLGVVWPTNFFTPEGFRGF